MQAGENDILIELDEVTGCFYIVWQPMPVIGAGRTGREALEDARAAAHLGIDTLINQKLTGIA